MSVQSPAEGGMPVQPQGYRTRVYVLRYGDDHADAQYAETQNETLLTPFLLSQDGMEVASRIAEDHMPWICPRCQKVHSDLSMTCDCPPPTYTGSSTGIICTCAINLFCPVHPSYSPPRTS